MGNETARIANERNRLLGLLAIIVAARQGLLDETVMNKVDDGLKRPAWKHFIKGERDLSEQAAKNLVRQLKQWITAAAKDNGVLCRDLAFLRSTVLNELDRTDHLALTGNDDQFQLDRELLTAFRIDMSSQSAPKVLSYAQGFWYVIRYSTGVSGTEDFYNVALLSVNPTDYTRLMGEEKKPVRVVTAVPHFSLRAGAFENAPGDVRERIYRGHIIETVHPAQVLNFIGSREARDPPLLMMTLKMNEATPHATEGHGIIVTSNKESVIAGPVGACFVPLAKEIEARRDELSEGTLRRDPEISRLYRKQREELENHIVRRYTESELTSFLAGLCAENSVRNVVEALKQSRKRVAEGQCAGYYSVRNE